MRYTGGSNLFGSWAETLMDSAEDRSQGTIWGKGISLALVVAYFGVTCFLTNSATFISLRPMRLITYSGVPAAALGFSCLAAAMFMHCHWVWSSHEKYHGYGTLGKLLAATAFVIALLTFAISGLIGGLI
ncbi:MAG: hypothetical protein KDA69_04875 [Planctomycetaceae bacterium]|nr:hypothetical protein [Planctomycetaceae bacterium]